MSHESFYIEEGLKINLVVVLQKVIECINKGGGSMRKNRMLALVVCLSFSIMIHIQVEGRLTLLHKVVAHCVYGSGTVSLL